MWPSDDMLKTQTAPRRLLLCLLALAYIGMLGHQFSHEYEAEHTEAEPCTLCMVADRLDDSVLPCNSLPALGTGAARTCELISQLAESTEAVVAVSRGPPAAA